MLYLIHALIGSLIGNSFDSLLLIAILAVLSHFILDMIPHWDGFYEKEFFHKNGRIKITKKMIFIELIDGLIALDLIIYFYFKFSNPLIIFGSLMSLLPDIAKLGYLAKLKKNKFFMKYLIWHSKIQKETDWKLGLLIQAIIFIALFLMF